MRTSLHHRYPHISVSVEPTTEPVSVEEALAFAQFEDCDAQSGILMASLIKAARRKVETDAAVALITQTRQIKLDGFCGPVQEIHLVPVSSIESIIYLDTAGDSQTLDADRYQLDAHNVPPRIRVAPNACWPATQCGAMQAVTITFIAGYGDADDVPDEAKLAIMLLAKEWFWNRCATGMVGNSISNAYGSLIAQLSWRAWV